MEIIKLKDCKEMKTSAAEWFASKWSIPAEAYSESIGESFSSAVPGWYLCLDNGKIVAGMGVIENDFHSREDLTPNVCAVYTEPPFRGQGIAGKLLDYVCKDMSAQGINTLYLVTDHIGFYEKYGWEYYGNVNCDDGTISRMYVHCEK